MKLQRFLNDLVNVFLNFKKPFMIDLLHVHDAPLVLELLVEIRTESHKRFEIRNLFRTACQYYKRIQTHVQIIEIRLLLQTLHQQFRRLGCLFPVLLIKHHTKPPPDNTAPLCCTEAY